MSFLRQLLVFLLISNISLPLFGNTQEVDSLLSKLSVSKGKEKCDLINQIANYYQEIDTQQAFKYAQEAFKIADESIYSEGKSLALSNLGLYYLNIKDYNSSLEKLNRGFLTAKATKCKSCIAETANNLGKIYYRLGNYEKALKILFEASNSYSSIADNSGSASSLYLIGLIYFKLGNNQLAKNYLENAVALYAKLDEKINEANAYQLLGEMWFKLGSFHKSITFLQESLKCVRDLNSDASPILLLIAQANEKSGNINIAIEICNESLNLAVKNKNLLIAGKCRLFLGNIYLNKGDNKKAEGLLNESYKYASKESHKELLAEIYFALSQLSENYHNSSLAYKYLKLSTSIRDSAYNEENSRRIENLQISYDADEIQKQNEILRKNNQIQSLQIAKQRNLTVALILLFSTILLIVFFVIFLYSNKRKSNRLLIESNNEINRQKTQLEEVLVKLNASEIRNRAILQAIPDIIFLVDHTGQIKEFQAPIGSVFSQIKDFKIGESFSNVLAQETAISLNAVIELAKYSLEVESCEFQHENSGEIHDLEGRAVKAGDDLYLLIIRDVTERKRLEQHLLIAKNEAEKATMSKSMYLATMSHEIRTPLSGIIGLSDILKETNLSRQQLEYVDIIFNSGNSLLTLINDVLDYSKVEAGQLTLENREFNPADVIQETTNLLYFKAKDKDIQLFTSISPNIPNCVIGDSTRLMQILMNLTNNAIKFTHEGSVTIECKPVSTTQDKIIIQFNIVDTGVGITEEDKNNLFNPFFQVADSSRFKGEGTGLGLAISKNLTSMMNGEIGVESVWGKGSTFWFTAEFELINKSAETEKKSVESRYASQKPASSNLNILIAEDDPINQKLISLILTKAGHYYEIAENGLIALDKYKSRHFDIVLMDVDMPKMDGIEATINIRELEVINKVSNKIKIVAVTAKAVQGDRNKCMQAGMDGYVSKPFKPEDLLNCIADLCQK